MTMNPTLRSSAGRACRERGTTLIEMMIAVALFALISGVAFKMMSQQQNASLGLAGQVGLTMGLRNAATMIQMDLANAGSHYYQDVNKSYGVLGVTILNNVVAAPTGGSTSCHATGTTVYGPTCFDQLTVLAIDNTYTLNPTNSSGALGSTVTNTSMGTAYGMPMTANNSQTVAAYFHTGDQLLFLTNNGTQYTSVMLSQNATASSSTAPILFTFQPTNANGSNTSAYDPLNISTCGGSATCAATTPPLTKSFGGSTGAYDYILKLVPVTYLVCSGPGSPTAPYACDPSANSPDIADPKLMRVVGSKPGVSTASVVMDQVIGFKVGASVWNSGAAGGAGDFNNLNYVYDASAYSVGGATPDSAYNFTVLRSVRVSLIARTAPAFTGNSATVNNYTYRNGFDGGPYQVQGTALVVNPRNMNF